jgi:hypothetical protein
VLSLNPFVPALLNVSFMTLPAWLVLFGVVIARTASAGQDRAAARARAANAAA